MNFSDESFLKAVRIKYEGYMGDSINDSRKRNHVEHRAALSNALRPYATTHNLGKLWGRDHSTIVHYNREHLPLIDWSPEYRFKYGVALACTQQVADEFNISPIRRTLVRLEAQLKQLDEILMWVGEMREKVQEQLDNKHTNH